MVVPALENPQWRLKLVNLASLRPVYVATFARRIPVMMKFQLNLHELIASLRTVWVVPSFGFPSLVAPPHPNFTDVPLYTSDRIACVDISLRFQGTQSSNESVTSYESSTDDQNKRKTKRSVKKTNIPSINPYEDQAGSGNMVCVSCEKPDENLITCKGSCQRFYHALCVALAEGVSDYTCPECLSGIYFLPCYREFLHTVISNGWPDWLSRLLF